MNKYKYKGLIQFAILMSLIIVSFFIIWLICIGFNSKINTIRDKYPNFYNYDDDNIVLIVIPTKEYDPKVGTIQWEEKYKYMTGYKFTDGEIVYLDNIIFKTLTEKQEDEFNYITQYDEYLYYLEYAKIRDNITGMFIFILIVSVVVLFICDFYFYEKIIDKLYE